MQPLFALLIGVREYANPDHDIIDGVDKDIKHVRQYLLDDLQVPSSHILTLQDKDATRANILSRFQSHLIDNNAMRDGDTILFHFSGHGSRSPAPANWPIIEKTHPDDEEHGQLEMILPYDEGQIGADGFPICGIPDRTLGALLDGVALAHGDNITVVLDCCHSGHGTRSGVSAFWARRVDPSRVAPLRADVDREIWDPSYLQDHPSLQRSIQNHQQFLRGGFTQRKAKSHVLMAACGQKESAMGNDEGGVFTKAWLKALRNPGIHPRTYSEILKYIDRDIDILRMTYPADIDQHPQCEGVTRDRLVFENVCANRDTLLVVPDGERCCRIDGPCELMGIKSGTQLELYYLDNKLRVSTILGTAIVENVLPDRCFARTPPGLYIDDRLTAAHILNHPYHLRFAVVNPLHGSKAAQHVVNNIEKSLSTASSNALTILNRVQETEHADLILEVNDDSDPGVTLRRLDVDMRDLQNHPRLNSREVEIANFPRILVAISRFNFYLNQTNPLHPFAGDVSMELHLLKPDSSSDPYGDARITELKALKQEVLFQNDEARILDRSEDNYAFVLRNAASADLFPHVIYFDPNTYEISIWYTPWEDKATLLKGGTLQIGASPEYNDVFQFFVPKGLHVDTCFIKVFLMAAPAKMAFMEQHAQVGSDENGNSNVMRTENAAGAIIETPLKKGGWDSITQKITVTR